MTRRSGLRAATALALLAAGPAAASDDQWAQQVKRYMDATAKPFFERGYRYGAFTHTGSLNNQAVEVLPVRLAAGIRSQIMGGCDTDCSDLDLVLYDPSGQEVDSDAQTDDYPIVSTLPKSDGVYRLKVVMAKCSAEPCRYAIQQYVK